MTAASNSDVVAACATTRDNHRRAVASVLRWQARDDFDAQVRAWLHVPHYGLMAGLLEDSVEAYEQALATADNITNGTQR